MISVRKSTLLRAGLALALAAMAAAVFVGAVSASTGAELVTPSFGDVDVYFDVDGNGDQDAGEFVGTFPGYHGNAGITFSWDAVEFPAGVNGAYRVSLLQNFTPLGEPTWKEFKVSHHWADNPAGTVFEMGPFFTSEGICEFCPSHIVIQPETYEYAGDEFVYTPYGAEIVASLTESDEFVLTDLVTPKPPKQPEACEPIAGQCYCNEDTNYFWVCVVDTCGHTEFTGNTCF